MGPAILRRGNPPALRPRSALGGGFTHRRNRPAIANHREGDAKAASASRFGAQTVERLGVAFEASSQPMLIADDDRRWVTGNGAAAELLGLTREQLPWRSMDDFAPSDERRRLADQWDAFLKGGEAEGLYELYLADSGPLPVEFSAIANIMPSRHLATFIPLDGDSTASRQTLLDKQMTWKPVAPESRRLPLTGRESEVLALVASGMRGADIAEHLFLVPETVKSHIQNAMTKLDTHTRAHAVAVALVTEQIAWEG